MSNGILCRLHNPKGQSMVEFVVVVPVLILMFWSVLYFGQAVVFKSRVAMAARYAAMKAARGFPVGDINTLFFRDIGQANASTFTGESSAMTWIGYAAYGVALAIGSGEASIPLLTTSLANIFLYWEDANTAEVHYTYSPPPGLRFVGNHQVSAGLYVDGDPWEWRAWKFSDPLEFRMNYLMAGYAQPYLGGFGWTPFIGGFPLFFPLPILLDWSFPAWYYLWAWFFLPPFPGYDPP